MRTLREARWRAAGLVGLAVSAVVIGVGPVQALEEGAASGRVVTPVAPEAHPISGCGRYGFLGMLGTEGVSYRLVEGDGRQGQWRVQATASPGYRLASGAPNEWSGDLGRHVRCATSGSGNQAAAAPASTSPAEVEGVEGEGLLSERGERVVQGIAIVMGGVALVCGVVLVVLDRQRRRAN